jgi:hypothetical protein
VADQEKRKQLVWEIERKLAEDGARPIIFYDRRETCWQPYVAKLPRSGCCGTPGKSLVPTF